MTSMLTRLLFITGVLLQANYSEEVGPDSDENNDTKYATVLDLIARIAHDSHPPCDALQHHKDCDGVPDGAYQYANANNCSHFYRCEKQKQINCTCGSRHVFDAVTQSCITGSPQTPPCLGGNITTTSCSESANGGYHVVAGTQCKKYYECRDYRRIDYQCPPDKMFDVETLSCSPADRIACSDSRRFGVRQSVDCENKADGKYSIVSNSSKFYVCDNHVKILEGFCQEQQVFVEKLQRCVTVTLESLDDEEQSIRPTASYKDDRDRCADRSDGYFPAVQTHCRRFYSCKNGREVFEKECPEETLFDSVTGQCHDYDEVVCSQQTSKPDVDECTDRTDGYHLTSSTHCLKFILCSRGQRVTELVCPRDGDSSERCPNTPRTRQCDEAEQHVASEDEDCLERENGEYHPDLQTGCQNFFYCKDGKKTRQLSCHVGHIFDSSSKSCQPANRTVCGHGDTSPMSVAVGGDGDKCGNKPDGYYSDVSIQCKGFYQCRDGRVTSELGCQKGNVFDEVSQRCRSRQYVTCPPKHQHLSGGGDVGGFGGGSGSGVGVSGGGDVVGGVSGTAAVGVGGGGGEPPTAYDELPENVCKSKSDGFYPNYSTGCRRYYHCRQFHKMAEYVCTAGQLFDPISSQCLQESKVNCSKSTSQQDPIDTCRSKSDGYYPNYSNGCRSYYYCRGRTKIVDLTCPLGKLFETAKGGCNDETTATCDAETKNVNSTDEIQTRPRSDFNCLHRFDGLYTDVANGCSQYHVCVNSQLIKTGQCPDGQLFDSSGQSCKPANQVSCDDRNGGKNTTTTTTLREVGLHFHFGSACRNTTVCFESIDALYSHCSNLLPDVAPTADDDDRHLRHHRACKIGGLSEMRRKESHDILSSYDCKGKEDGYYTDPESQCRKWHMCEGGLGTTHECDRGKAFNILHRRCDASHTVACANQSWVYRNYSFERSFPSIVSTKSTASTDATGNQCLRKSDGIYIDLVRQFSQTPACFSVLLCIRDKAYDISCPFESRDGLDWDVNCSLADGFNGCLRENRVSTGRTASTEQPLPPPPPPPPSELPTMAALTQLASAPQQQHQQQQQFSCANQSDGYYDDRTSSCQSFHVCYDGGQLASYSCAPPLLFDADTKSCELPDRVHCPLDNTTRGHSHRLVPCEPTADRLHPDVGTGCRSYFGCIAGKFRYNQCPENTLFDARTSSCSSKTGHVVATCSTSVPFSAVDSVRGAQSRVSHVLLSPPPNDDDDGDDDETSTSISFDCTDKPDGFYPDYNQKCHVFYRCIQGKKFSHYCKLGQLFNVQLQSCDFQENVTCQTVIS